MTEAKFKKAAQPCFGAFVVPKGASKGLEVLNKIGTPTQRVVIGSTAMVLQPLIDLSNKNVDEKTRQTSASRSFSRAIIGTISGILVRVGCIELGNALTKNGKYLAIEALKSASPDQIKNYSKAVGNILSLGVLLFSNFLFDVPLINKMAAVINEKVFGNKPANAPKSLSEEKGGSK